jgi:hypothetical protein
VSLSGATIGAPVEQIVQFQCVAAGGSDDQARVFDLPLGDVWCSTVDVDVPRGNNGCLTWLVQYAGVTILPWAPINVGGDQQGVFQVDDFRETFTLDCELGAGLTLVAVNTGYWPHAVYVRFHVTPIAAYSVGTSAPPVLLDLSDSSAAVDLSTVGSVTG